MDPAASALDEMGSLLENQSPNSPAAITERSDPAITIELNPQERFWTFRDIGFFILFAAGTLLLVGLLVMGGFTLLNRALGWGISLNDPGVQTPLAVLVQIGSEVLWIFFIYQTVVVQYRLPFWKGIGWNPVRISPAYYLLAGCAISLLVQVLVRFVPNRPELPIEELFDTPASVYLLAVFGIGVAPFVEELVFRGFFFPVFERRWGARVAVILTGALFAAIHAPQLGWGLPELAVLLLVGLALSLARARTGSLIPSYLIHLGYNSSLFVLLFISTNRFQTLPG